MKHFQVPMYALLHANDARAAVELLADHLIGVNAAHPAAPRVLICEASDPAEIPDGEIAPTDLVDNIPAIVQTELDLLRGEQRKLTDERKQLAQLLSCCEQALGSLIEECESNCDFADQHASEVEALGAATEVHALLAEWARKNKTAEGEQAAG